MAVFSSQRKVCGSAAALLRYYEEESSIKLGPYLKYHDIGIDATVLGNVAGSAAERLPGLDLELGLTRRQHADLHNGQWQGQQLVKGRYRHVWETDAKGRAIKIPDETGKLVKVPVMEPMLDKFGHEVIDPMNGKPLMKQKTESASVNGYDITFALDKSAAELIIARPELTDMVKRNFLQAVNTAMKVGVEEQVPLVVLYKDGVKTKHTAELVWFSAFGASSRPTDDSVARGYEADPHIHIHVFLSSMSYCQGKWKKIDGKELFRQGELRQSVCSNEFNRLMENDGVKIAYSDPDRKGHIHSEVQGSNLEARQFFSTQSKRLWELQLAFEREYKRPPTQTELKEIGSATKAKKSKAAKAADELGNLDQIRKWRTALHEAGIKLDIPKPGQAVKRESKDVRLDILIERLNRPEGVARDIESAAVFGPEVILPAVYRAAEGLGFDTDELNLISGVYRDTNLIQVRDPDDPTAERYTTQAIRDAEKAVTEGLDHLASKPVRSVPSSQVTIAIRAQKYALDHEQEKLVREICGARHIVHGTGKAGSGKTAAMKPAVEALRRSGLVNRVVVVSEARKRANETGEAVKAEHSWSVDALTIAVEKGWKPDDKTMVILDEVAMFSSVDMANTLGAIGDKARLVTIGDEKQQTAIGAAGWYADELDKRPAFELNKVHRQKDHRDVTAFNLIREGKAEEALENLHARGRIHAADTTNELMSLAKDRWEHYREEGKGVDEVVVVHTGHNSTSDTLNRLIQGARLDANEISEFECFDVAEQTTGRKWRLYKGDRCIFNTGVYDGLSQPILNGTMATIVKMDRDGSCRVRIDGDERREVTVRLSSEAQTQPIAPAYSLSSSKMQGGQVPVCLVVPGNPKVSSLNSAYAATTRGIESTEILLSREIWGEHPLPKLAEAWSAASEKHMATPYIRLMAEEQQELAITQSHRQKLGMSQGMSL